MIKRYQNGSGFGLYHRKLRWKFYSRVAMGSNISRVDSNINVDDPLVSILEKMRYFKNIFKNSYYV